MSYMGDGRHLKQGDPRPPPPAKDMIRIYGMRFCPFEHRLKLVLFAKQLEHETVNINLAEKPSWLLQLNPRGKIPILELNGEVLCESIVMCDFVDAEFVGSRRLTTVDPLRRAKELILLGDLDKAAFGFFGLERAKCEQSRGRETHNIRCGLGALSDHLTTTGQPFICPGPRPGMSDYMFWPFLERIHVEWPELVHEVAPLSAYYERMSDDEAVRKCRQPDAMHRRYAASVAANNPVYDV